MDASLHQAYLKAKEKFLPYNGVVGVGYGEKLKDGKRYRDRAIIVFVEKKLPPAEVTKGQLIPPVFEDFPTDVREPRLTIERGKSFNVRKPPTPEQETGTDLEWIDWGKIHQINQHQHQAGRRTRKPKAGGVENNPADNQADATGSVVGETFVVQDTDGHLVTTLAGGAQVIDWAGAWNIFRGQFGDDYDFVTFFADVASGLPDSGNASGHIFNNVTGIGVGAVNNRAAWSSTRLLRYSFHSWFSLRTLLHEMLHQWSMFVNYRTSPTGTTQDLLHEDWVWDAGQKGYHWGRWADNENSCMDYDRADWVDNGDGTFNRVIYNEDLASDEHWFGYHPLDLYLMGLIPASEVPNITIVQSPNPAVNNATAGPYTPNPATASVSVTNIQDEEGVRNPDYLNSQRVFHVAVIVITRSASLATTFITDSEDWRSRHTDNFRSRTGGRAMIDTSLLHNNYSDIYVKDNSADSGTGASAGVFWESPDLWCRNTDDDGTDHLPPVRTQNNWIYVRVRNKSAQSYDNVTVRVYLGNFLSLTPGTEFFYPVDWNPEGLLGSATISISGAVGGVEGSTIAKIPWTADKIPPAAGWHPCLLAEVIPMELTPNTLHHVWENKKLAQRNITIEDPSDLHLDMVKEVGYLFNYEFQVGHPLRTAQSTRLVIQTARHLAEVQLFLDPGGLVEGIAEEAKIIQSGLPLSAGKVPSGAAGIQAFSGKELPELVSGEKTWVAGEFQGLTLFIPANTTLGLLPRCDAQPDADTLFMRFCNDTRIKFGNRASGTLGTRFQLAGLEPVLLNGLPLLRITNFQEASLALRLTSRKRQTMRLFGVVSGYRNRGQSALYRIMEVTGQGKVIGGVSLEVKV